MAMEWINLKRVLPTIESNLKCFVCKKLLENPRMLWCRHSFCNACIVMMKNCPHCNNAVTPSDAVPNIMLEKLLSVLRVASEVTKCSNEELRNINIQENVTKCVKLTPGNPTNNLVSEKNKRVEESLSPKRLTKSRNCKNSFKNQKNNVSLLEKSTPKTVPVQKTPTIKKASTNNEKNKKSVEPSLQRVKLSRSISPQTHILFSAKKCKINNVNVKGETPLQIACRQRKLLKVQQLLQSGAEPNVKDYANWTPLCDAVGSGDIAVVKALLSAGAAVNTPAHLNTTALLEAVLKRDKAMIELLLSYGADKDQRSAFNNTAWSVADDEIKALMLNSTVPIQPHPRVATAPRAILVNKLPQNQIDKVMILCQKFNLTLSTLFTEDITHVVVEKTSENTCHGSTEVLEAIARGCSVVGMDWVEASLETELLPVDLFEPTGTKDSPNSNVFKKSRLNKEQLLPRLFDGCHISLQHDQSWSPRMKQDLVKLVGAAGAQFQPRACDAERIPPSEQTVMFHAATSSPFALVSHIILYQPQPSEPQLKYNMAHVKSKPIQWFLQSIKTFTIS